MQSADPQQQTQDTLGIIAGGGRLPLQLVESCKKTARPCFVVVLEGYANPADFSDTPHAVVRLGAVGESLEHFRAAHARDLVMAGHVKRPSFTSIRPDVTGARLLARLSKKVFAGDDAILRTVIGFLEEEGFAILGADDVFSHLLSPEGVLGSIEPDARARSDIALAIQVAQALGSMDVGQAVIVEHGYVLGVEAAEGTDALITRCAGLKREEHAGVLVKWCKPNQESRTDLPSIGPDTIKAVAQAGLAGIAIQVGGSLLLDKEAAIAHADEANIFITGIRA